MCYSANETRSDMTPSGKVARKAVSAGGLILMVGLALTSCVGAATPPNPANALSMPTTLAVTVPDTGWTLRVERVLELDADVWVLAQLRREPGSAAQMIRKIEVTIPVTLPEKRLRVYVAGKTWAWRNDEPYEFVSSLEDVARRAGAARVVFPVPAK
jgi:hypothetical protein